MEKTAFKPLQDVLIDSLAEIGAPLLSCREVELYNGDVAFNVSRAYILACPFNESFKVYLFSTTVRHLKKIISNGITALEGAEREHRLPSEDILYTISTTNMLLGIVK